MAANNNVKTLLSQPVFNFNIHNCSSKTITFGFKEGYAVVSNHKGSPLNIKDNQITVSQNSQDVADCLDSNPNNIASVQSLGIYIKDKRISYYVPGSVSAGISNSNNDTYSFNLTRLDQGYEIFDPQVYKYTYLNNVQDNQSFKVWLHYYDPTHIGADTDDFMCSDLVNINKHLNGGYIQALGDPLKISDVNYDVYICDKSYSDSCRPTNCFEDPGY